ncbi:enoyl-CoA hydratase [Mycobacterium sp. Root135]|uniref:enoyl-CoA hydratase-related protein n=1 Tax=Mycobacterium sp. Root135 TaxID=1736457 RepID=UPI0006FDCAEC|nr:enoyl-CoA hydratase-related protein [Mycobacterium sp. Root135]KQY09961.1 enoyl-CoA hydratase [Mycobacterium sp. Root135]
MREFVSVHATDGVGTLVLSRPPTNTLTRQMCREIGSAAAELGERTDVAAVVVFGGHEIFSAGVDVGEARTIGADAAAVAAAVALRAVADVSKPTVAAVTGYALGSGLTLALAADWRIGGDNVKWGATQILDGLAPSHDDAELLARAIGDAHAKELAFTGRFAHAKEALELGLVDELVAPDHVYDSAVAWARRFVDVPPEALAAAKAAFRPASPGR